MGRRYHSRFECAHEGCPEWTIFEHDTRKEQSDCYQRQYGKWRCIRHQNPEQLLGLNNRKLVHEVVADQRPHGVYWGHHGFLFGPGFKAFAKDFPAGTILRVTAEIITPDGAERVHSLNGGGSPGMTPENVLSAPPAPSQGEGA